MAAKYISYCYWLTGVCLVLACQSRKVSSTTPPMTPGPHILFLTFQLTQNPSQSLEEITLMDTQLVPGKAKTPPYTPPHAHILLRFVFLNNQGEILEKHDQEHPLFRSVEAVDDRGELQRKEVVIPEATLMLRVNHSPQFSRIRIERLQADQSPAVLTTINLQLP